MIFKVLCFGYFEYIALQARKGEFCGAEVKKMISCVHRVTK